MLGGYASAPQAPAIIMVTHHVEEIPIGFSSAMLLSHGSITAAGPIHEVITSQNLSDTFGLALQVDEIDGRYTARAT
jgi:iron complex transport system ATP-binding protein